MVTITRQEVGDKAKLDALVSQRLDDICEDTGEVRRAAATYFREMIEEDLKLSDNAILNPSFDAAEGLSIGFLSGYRAALANHGLSS